MSRKILRLISVVLSLMMIFASVYTIFSHFNRNVKVAEGLETKEFAADGDAEARFSHDFDTYTNVIATNNSYSKPDITLDDVIKELSNYGGAHTWTQGSAGYGDYWFGSNQGSSYATKTKDSTYTEPSKVTELDCGSFIYAGLRHLDVRFTGFYDGKSNETNGRIGPLPVAPYAYINYNNLNDIKPYHIKWENGEEIVKITDFTSREHWDEGSQTFIIDCNYKQWIDKEKIAPGTIVVAPPIDAKKAGHVWLYIGQYASKADIVAYLKRIGVTIDGEDGNTTGIRVLDEEEGSTYWSIECRGNSHANGGGVAITNRDPAAASGNKMGSGYVGFTFLEEKVTNGSFSMDIKKVDRATGKALQGAKFHFEDRNTNPVTKRDDIVTGSNGVASLVSGKTIDSEKTYTYSIMENDAPDGYIKDITKHFGINVNTGLVGREYQVKNVKIHGNGINEKTIDPGKSYRYLTNGTWEEGDTVSPNTLFHVKLDGSKTNMHLALTWANPEIKGKFKLDLVKFNKEGEKLGGAEFKVDVKEGDTSIYSNTKTTSSDEASLGTATFSDIPIRDEAKKI